jgi:orotate phosphoribosyltransferase
VVIDGVIATGGSTTAAISAIRSEGGEVEDIIVLIDRFEGARKDEKILEKWRLASLAD